MLRLHALLCSLALVTACGRTDSAADAGAPDSGVDAGPVDKTAACASTFGNAIGAVGFARFDGTVLAVLPPGNATCTSPNSTPVVIELTMSGAVYRMVVDVNDLNSPGTIRFKSVSHELIGGPWADGWHTGVPLDYISAFGLHSVNFEGLSTADAVARLTDALTLGAHVSIFATAAGEVDSAHLIHRTKNSQDGAIVVDLDGTPTWLLLNFSNYVF